MNDTAIYGLCSGTTHQRLVPPDGRKHHFHSRSSNCRPLLGSFFTEPAAMTLLALMLKWQHFVRDIPPKLSHATLGMLFENISIGRPLNNFPAPLVAMIVASDTGAPTIC
jgi:hypothetical protein